MKKLMRDDRQRNRTGSASPAADTAGSPRLAPPISGSGMSGSRGGAGRRGMRVRKCDGPVRAGMEQISGLRDALGMTDACAEYAACLFRGVASSGFLTGRTVSHCAAAAALLACRKHGMDRTARDVMAATGLERRDVYRTYRQLYEKFGLNLPVPDPASFVDRIREAAGMVEAVGRDARAVLASADRAEIAGKDPVGLAAGALYVSCVRLGEVAFRRDIAKAAGVAESTLTDRYKDLTRTAAV